MVVDCYVIYYEKQGVRDFMYITAKSKIHAKAIFYTLEEKDGIRIKILRVDLLSRKFDRL